MGGLVSRAAGPTAASKAAAERAPIAAENAARAVARAMKDAPPAMEMNPELLRAIEKVVAEKKETANPYAVPPEEFERRKRRFQLLHRERDASEPPPGRLTEDQLVRLLKWRRDAKAPPIAALAAKLGAADDDFKAKAAARSVLVHLGTPEVWVETSSKNRIGSWVDLTSVFDFETAPDAPAAKEQQQHDDLPPRNNKPRTGARSTAPDGRAEDAVASPPPASSSRQQSPPEKM